ncbi:ferredoxin-type protein NapF [Halocynthiibacter sp. C4]|uniref:ferredoxin-type protein NapF n=1 Tax=Halocynthiibacter sp. C4 TaxID=2992758 RepID=UPI00237BB2FE|nr:ferredoxin-type protein NapF [Halocynthiibacter sp. C4]MDE0589159.1 ferredoxin-type protein NapF [Halocynthiibacter sp. C4]
MSLSRTETVGRRGFLTGRGEAQLRPPWATEESIRESCTSCGACISACPEAILIEGPAKTPTVDFSENACTFCRKCADACEEGVFGDTSEAPWNLIATIQNSCMLNIGVSCQICSDACMDDALRFSYLPQPSGKIEINTEACTGCGACISVCPNGAIELRKAPQGESDA